MSHKNNKIVNARQRAKIELAQLEALIPLQHKIEDVMKAHEQFCVIFIDTHIYESYNSIDLHTSWLSGALAEWLEVNAKIQRDLGFTAIHRIILLPYPQVISNVATRRFVIDYIRLLLHVHLWYGVICPIYFVDPRKMPDTDKITNHIFTAMPWSKIFISMPKFFSEHSVYQKPIEGLKSHQTLRDSLTAIGLIDKKPIWLYYDEDNFGGGKKLRGWRWKEMRSFFLSVTPTDHSTKKEWKYRNIRDQ